MVAALLVFVLVAGVVFGLYLAITRIPESVARRRIELRLRDVGQASEPADESVVIRDAAGPLPGVDRVIGRTRAGSHLGKLIEQSGVRTTPSAIVVASVVSGLVAAMATQMLVRIWLALVLTVPLGMALPVLFLLRRRSTRLKAFEEQFPEVLDLVSRAIRAGHAFQTALGMAADELPAPVGPEFRKVFDQQNFGLPLRDALEALAERVPLLDVKFFITAVSIQRDTGGNLAEILDNLAHVVRERFKILRQVRVHTAHGRITGFVLLALPPFLAVALSFIAPEHMRPLFQERVGQLMIGGTIVMQLIGYLWIRRVIRIEV